MTRHPIVDAELAKLQPEQKANYQNILLKICENHKKNGERPKLLIHSCCAVCTTVALDVLVEFMDIIVYFYNPNIHPEIEYRRREEAQKRFINDFNQKNNANIEFLAAPYSTDDFFARTKGMELDKEGTGNRCKVCYSLRMEFAADKALELNADYFATALTLSPMKNSQVINQIGFNIEEQFNVYYLPSDFKKNNGNVRSRNLCEEYNVYRQCYCGCIYAARDQEINFREVIKNAREYLENKHYED